MFEAFTGKVVLFALRGFIRELRGIRAAIDTLTDTIREVNQLPSRADAALPPPDPAPRRSILRAGDFYSVWLIEELCAQFRVPYDSSSDLEQIALDRGWITDEGDFLVVPDVARDSMLGYLQDKFQAGASASPSPATRD